MSVYTISDGKIVEEQTVNGYGGLIVVGSIIENQPITDYYGQLT